METSEVIDLCIKRGVAIKKQDIKSFNKITEEICLASQNEAQPHAVFVTFET
jgi:hypothetical protein